MPVAGIVSQPAWGSIAADAITAGTIATDAIGSAELATSAVVEITGTVVNTGGTATLGGVLGDPKNIDIATMLVNLGGRILHKSLTLDGSLTYNAFTVSGPVAVKIIGIVTGALTNHADTVSVGTASSAAGLIAATAGTAMQTGGQIWIDNAPSKFEVFPTNWVAINETIVLTSTANITGGVISLLCQYFPIQLGAIVQAA